ncbi:MAG: hypothetical protein JSR80_05520 [Verrucomicrobia bacterium]|nr:hypothetical protein [Verrucomicrobiota bacterium]
MYLELRPTDLSVCNRLNASTAIGNSSYVQEFRVPLSAPKTDLHLYLRGSDFMQSLTKTYSNSLSNVQSFKPLEQVLEVLTQKIDLKKGGEQETNAIIQRALKKENGYFIRLFSNESWDEWLEDKTALGRVVSLFTDYCESSKPLTSFVKRLDEKIIEKANREAANLLSSLKEKRSVKKESSDCGLGLLVGSGLTLATQNPLPLGLATLDCLQGVNANQDALKRMKDRHNQALSRGRSPQAQIETVSSRSFQSIPSTDLATLKHNLRAEMLGFMGSAADHLVRAIMEGNNWIDYTLAGVNFGLDVTGVNEPVHKLQEALEEMNLQLWWGVLPKYEEIFPDPRPMCALSKSYDKCLVENMRKNLNQRGFSNQYDTPLRFIAKLKRESGKEL